MQGTGAPIKGLPEQRKENGAEEGRKKEGVEEGKGFSGLCSGPDVGKFRNREGGLLCSGSGSGFLIKRAESTSTPLSTICIQTIFSGTINKNSLSIPLKIKTESKIVENQALLDSGSGGEFIDQNYAKTLNLPLENLDKPIPAINVDGTLKKKGTIKHYVNLDLEIFGQPQTVKLLVTRLGK